jgi:hypothetical protein
VATVEYEYNTGANVDWQNYANAFDGNAATYATSTGFQSSNWIRGTGLPTVRATGTITKVELGYRGYGSTTDIRPHLIPIIAGTDGDDHTLSVLATSDDGTIYYVDVTSDTNAPVTWDWDDVAALDVRHWATAYMKTAYLNSLHVRVTYTAPLECTIAQAEGQSDPTAESPINFTVTFSESVDDFATGDVTLSGTAEATTATVTGSGDTYNVAVSGMIDAGTVIASIAAGVAHNSVGVGNDAATYSDNEVAFSGIPHVDVDVAVITITALEPTLTKLSRVAVATISIVAAQPTTAFCTSPDAATITITAADPTFSKTSCPDVATIIIEAFEPTYTPPPVAKPDVATITISALQPTLSKTSCPDAASVIVQAFQPTVGGAASGSTYYYLNA